MAFYFCGYASQLAAAFVRRRQSFLPILLQRFDFLGQASQDVRAAFDGFDELLLPRHTVSKGGLVDVFEIVDAKKILCAAAFGNQSFPLPLQSRHGFGGLHAIFGEGFQFFANQRHFFFVRETQYEETAIVDAVAVVLHVPLALGFNLPFHRESEGSLSEFRRVLCADVVEAMIELARQPRRVGRLPLDVDFPRRCLGGQVRERHRRCVFVHAVVHHAASQEMVLHPLDHFFIEMLRHEK